MQQPPNRVGRSLPHDIPPMPEPMPPTLQRRRPVTPEQLSQSFPGVTIEPPVIPGTLAPEEGPPSAQVRALRRENVAIATAIITGAFIISRVIGILRASLFAYVFGLHPEADAYNFAFNLPDTVYNIVAGGALSSAFIPIFTEYLIERHDRKGAWILTSAAYNIFTVLLVILAGLAWIFAAPLAHIYAPGVFSGPHADLGKGQLIINLSRIMLLQPILLGLSIITTGVLQARQRFLLPAIGSILYNFGLIGGIVATMLDTRFHIFGGNLGIYGPTWGVVVAAMLQFLPQLPGLIQAKFRYSLSFNIFHPGIRRVFALMGPRIINSIALYASNFVILAILSFLDSGTVYGYRQAFQLVLLPLGIFGMAVSQAAFPTLAALVSSRDWQRMRSMVLTTVRVVLYLAVPSSLGMMVLAEPLTRLLLVHGNFIFQDASKVYIPLIYFAIGIPGLALVEILVRAFYALQDVRTTVEISILQFIFVIALSFFLINVTNLGAGALALATAIGATGEAFVLLLLLRPRMGWFRVRPLLNFLVGVIAASLVATLAALLTYTLLSVIALYVKPDLAYQPDLVRSAALGLELTAAAVVGAVIYYLGARFLGIEGTLPIDRIAARALRRGRR